MGECEHVPMQNMEQLRARDCHHNVTEPQATEYHTKSIHIHNTGTVSWALASFPRSKRERGKGWVSTVYVCT